LTENDIFIIKIKKSALSIMPKSIADADCPYFCFRKI